MNESEIRLYLCQLLCVEANASNEEIKKAYTAEAKKWHPDRVQHNSELAAIAEKKLKDINQAYECLTDPQQFDKHAAKLARRLAGESSGYGSGPGTSSSTGNGSSTGSGSSSSSASSSGNGSSTGSAAGTSGAAHFNQANSDLDKASIVKIFIAAGIFVLLVVAVANLTAPHRDSHSNPGITLSPEDSPGSPFRAPRTYPITQPNLAPDNSIGPPPAR